jgi:hypothetical protein
MSRARRASRRRPLSSVSAPSESCSWHSSPLAVLKSRISGHRSWRLLDSHPLKALYAYAECMGVEARRSERDSNSDLLLAPRHRYRTTLYSPPEARSSAIMPAMPTTSCTIRPGAREEAIASRSERPEKGRQTWLDRVRVPSHHGQGLVRTDEPVGKVVHAGDPSQLLTASPDSHHANRA